MTVQKAKLKIEGGSEVECLFNPKDYTVTKTNNWKAEPKQGATAAVPSFTGGAPWEMNLVLLFDASLLKPKVSVKQITQTLFDAMNASQGEGAGGGGKKNTKRPPTITFEYGWFSFIGVAKTLAVQYLLFTPEGEPIRAETKLSLMQWEPERKGQNPTTRAEGGHGAHVVREGDSLASIAQNAYGDPTQWRVIARANGIDDPLRLRSGATLDVPRLDT